jgi:hypothetical protein
MATSPFNLFFGKTAPALPANRQFFSFEENVQLDVLTLALVLPGILTMLQQHQPPIMLHVVAKTLLKPVQKLLPRSLER